MSTQNKGGQGNLNADIEGLPIASYRVELPGKVLDAADLMSQLADRMYIEERQFFYCDFREARMRNYEDKPRLVVVGIRDSGVGIAEEHRKRIFEGFYPAKNSLNLPPTFFCAPCSINGK